jgi:N4-gp56 family major capsid protein
MTKMMMLCGQWMRNKEDLLMRDLFASSPAYLNATGGLNGDSPSNITRANVNNVERVLLGQDALTMLQSNNATNQFSTAGMRDSFIALCSTDITPDLQNTDGVLLKNAYPGNQESFRPEEYCQIGRFRFFVSSKGIKIANASGAGNTVYQIPMYGMEAIGKIEQNNYTAIVGFRPSWVVSAVGQNVGIYAKFAIARAIQNQNWLSGLNVTQRL